MRGDVEMDGYGMTTVVWAMRYGGYICVVEEAGVWRKRLYYGGDGDAISEEQKIDGSGIAMKEMM